MNISGSEQDNKKELLAKSWEYLYKNFPKFKERNKIDIALTLAGKDMPNKHEHSGQLTHIIINTNKINDKPE